MAAFQIAGCCDGCSSGMGGCFGDSRSTMGRVGVWPHEVEAEIARVDGVANSVDVTIKKCYPEGSPKRLAWDATLASWRQTVEQMKSASTGWSPISGWLGQYFGRGGDYDLAQEFERRFRDFADQAAADGCQGSPKVSPRGDREDASADQIASTLKWVAGAAIVVAGVYALKSFLP